MNDLLESSQDLPVVAEAAAREYAERASELAAAVDLRLRNHPEADRLRGGNEPELLKDNHQNHARFMVNVFRLSDFELMARIAVWAYRAYRARNLADDYFPIHLDAWRQVLAERLAPASAAALMPAYDWMIANHDRLLAASQEEPAALTEPGGEWRTFLGHILVGRSREALEVADEQVSDKASHQAFLLEQVRPALLEVGRLWEIGQVSVAQEHLASAVVRRVMAGLYAKMPLSSGESGRVMVACVPGESHDLAGRILADFLEMDGFDVRFVGASMPGKEFIAGLEAFDAGILMLSVTMPFNLDRTESLIRRLRSHGPLADLKIMVGGQAFSGRPDLWRRLGSDGFATDPRGAVRQAAAWCEEASA